MRDSLTNCSGVLFLCCATHGFVNIAIFIRYMQVVACLAAKVARKPEVTPKTSANNFSQLHQFVHQSNITVKAHTQNTLVLRCIDYDKRSLEVVRCHAEIPFVGCKDLYAARIWLLLFEKNNYQISFPFVC